MNCSRIFSKLTKSALVLFCVSVCLLTSFAATGIYLGNKVGNIYGSLTGEFRYYLYYNSNTADELDIYSQAAWVLIDEDSIWTANLVKFSANEVGSGTKYDSYTVRTSLEAGKMTRVEVPWEDAVDAGEGTAYVKNVDSDGTAFCTTYGGMGYSAASGFLGLIGYWTDSEYFAE